VQTALLSAGIAIILALVTALVGPFFVDWGSYRAEFETRVAHLTGLEVRVTGAIDVRILPTPTLTLQQIELGRPGDPAKTRARALRIEFALGDLMRGALRAPDLKLQGPELTLRLDPSGRLAWSAPTIGLDPDAVSIEHLEIEDGRATLADAASGTRLVLDKLDFNGQVRSLLGPVKGEGSFVLGGQHYPFQLSVSRPGGDGGVKVRLNLDPIDNPRTVDVDGTIWIERGLPRFDGTLQLARPVGRSSEGITESWRISSHVRADGAAAVLDQVEFQYGSEERAIRLKGDANLSFGAKPELVATLSAPQIDLDRILAMPEAVARRPLVAIRTLAESFVRAQRLPVPVKLGISVETLTLAGAMLQRVGGDLKSDGDGWNIENFSLRAPGLTQVGISGRLGAAPGGVAFNGATKIESADPRALIGWLADRGNGQVPATGPLRFTGNVVLSADKIAFDRLQAELDRMKIDGHIDYAWPDGDQPAKLNVALHAPELDLDRAQSLLASLGEPLEWPREGTLAIDIGRTAVAGVEAKDLIVKMRRDPGGLDVERLAIGDIGGAKLTVSGRIDTHESVPRGAMTLDLDARSLDGMAALIGKFSAPVADRIRRTASRSVPAKLHASLALDRDAAGTSGASTSAKLKLQGSAGVFRLDLQGDASGGTLASIDLARLGSSKIRLTGLVDATDGSALVDLLGLDRLVTVNQRSGRLTFDLNGPLDGDMAVNGQLLAGGLDISANGTMHPSGSPGPTARIALKAAAANVVPLRSTAARTAQPPWSTLTARLMLADGAVTLADINGTLAGVGVKGELGIGMTAPMRMNGDINIAALDLPAVIGSTIGFPRQNGNGDGGWPADPFETGLLGAVNGQIKVKAGQAALTSKLTARDLRAVLDFSQAGLAVAEIDGVLAGGRISGDFGFERGDDGITAHSHLKLAEGDAVELLGDGARAPLSGKLTVELALAGTGRSPVALIGSLKGEGTYALRDGSIARFDPAAFDIVTRAVDQGLPIDVTRIGARMEAALAIGALPFSLAEGSIAATMGQLRLVDPAVQVRGAEFAATGSIDLTQSAIDARLVLSGPKAADASARVRPDISVSLKGPIDAPRRTLDVTALANWLALRAVDQKAKRVEALEQAAREHPVDAGEITGSPAEREPTDTVPAAPPVAPPRAARPSSVAGPAGKTGDEPRVRRPTPTVEQALPPPIDIRPTAPHGPRG
jgi:large subunit ribosomal protein L24